MLARLLVCFARLLGALLRGSNTANRWPIVSPGEPSHVAEGYHRQVTQMGKGMTKLGELACVRLPALVGTTNKKAYRQV